MHNHAQWKQSLFIVFFAGLFGWALIYPFWQQRQSSESTAQAPVLKDVPDFTQYHQVQKKKRAFFHYLKPELVHQNALIKQDRIFLKQMRQLQQQGQSLDQQQQQRLQEICNKYEVEAIPHTDQQWQDLLSMVDVVPVELTLVQAANESAWGTSRFARRGYNFFGLWCYRKGCGFVPRRREDDAVHEVAKFRNLRHAVKTYLLNLNSYYAYDHLREIRSQLRQQGQKVTAEALAKGLVNYSTRRQEYVQELIAMIRHNEKYMQ